MANLLFKKGSYEEFKSKVLTGNNAVEGALYLTENEGALYLGQNGGTVKRISGYVQVYADLTSFVEDGPKPPYSTDVIYFIAAENALVRYDDKSSKWVQLNVTASKIAKLESSINKNTGDIEAINAALATNTENIGKNTEAITALRTELTEDIEGLDERVGVVEESLETKASQTDLNTLTGRVDAQDTALENYGTSIGKNESDISTLQTDLEDLNTKVESKASQIALNNLTNQVANKADQSELDTLEGEVERANEGILTLDENKADKKDLDDLQEQIDVLNEILGGSSDSSIADRLNTLESDNATNKEAISEHASDIEALENGVTDLNTAISGEGGLNERLSTAEGEIDVLQTDLSNLTGTVNGINGRLQTAEGDIDNLQAKDVELAKKVEALEAIDFATKTDVSDAESRLNTTINERILAANAMTYKDKVNSEIDLPTEDVTVGDTYVVATAFGDYQVGDLLIAKGTEVNGVIDSDTLDWDHIPTGYSDAHDSELMVENNTIKLLDFSGNVLGAAVIKSTSNNIVVSTENDNEITMTLQWDTF